MAEFGSGPRLDGSFDFSVDSVGDIEGSSGLDELEKDLAVQMGMGLSEYLGETSGGNTGAKLEGDIIDIAERDSRVRNVPEDRVTVDFVNNGEKIDIRMTARTIEGLQELVIGVE